MDSATTHDADTTNTNRNGNIIPTINIEKTTSASSSRPSSSTSSCGYPNAFVPAPYSTVTSSRPPSRSSVGIRRLPSSSPVARTDPKDGRDGTGRRRSLSAPQKLEESNAPESHITKTTTTPSYMPSVHEEPSDTARHLDTSNASQQLRPSEGNATPSSSLESRSRAGSRASQASSITPDENATSRRQTVEPQYDSNVVNLLDVVDPEVSTLSTLTNVQNSLFVPNLGRLINRRLTYELTPRPTTQPGTAPVENGVPHTKNLEGGHRRNPDWSSVEEGSTPEQSRDRRLSFTSELDDNEGHFAVLPHGERLEGWTQEDLNAINDHVRHQLHSKKARFKRQLQGFGKYVRRPLGFFVTLYATLITLFGLIWVLFLIGWISVGGRKGYVTNVIDNVLVALFAIMGDGLAPFRAVDTYHMCFVAHYHHLTWRLRREHALPNLPNQNDLPTQLPSPSTLRDVEAAPATNRDDGGHEYSLLTCQQQKRLEYHQTKFSKSHTFYKSHETSTHYAFPLRLLVAAVVLLDCHSLFQIALGSFTWGWNYHTRPQWITAVILSLSICVNITAGIVISIGDRMTRKRKIVERIFRQSLTEEALRKVGKTKHETAGEKEKILIEHERLGQNKSGVGSVLKSWRPHP